MYNNIALKALHLWSDLSGGANADFTKLQAQPQDQHHFHLQGKSDSSACLTFVFAVMNYCQLDHLIELILKQSSNCHKTRVVESCEDVVLNYLSIAFRNILQRRTDSSLLILIQAVVIVTNVMLSFCCVDHLKT